MTFSLKEPEESPKRWEDSQDGMMSLTPREGALKSTYVTGTVPDAVGIHLRNKCLP